MELPVDDLIVRQRIVQVPDHCPNCGADLTKQGAIRVWEYQDQHRQMHFLEDTVEFEDDLPQQGETYLLIFYECRECEHYLAGARERQVEAHQGALNQMFDALQTLVCETRVEPDSPLEDAGLKGIQGLIEKLAEDASELTLDEDDLEQGLYAHIEHLRHTVGVDGSTIDQLEHMCSTIRELKEMMNGPRQVPRGTPRAK